MTNLHSTALALIEAEERAIEELPFDIEKWLITIKAHCTVIADCPDDDIKVLAACIKINVDDELRPAIARALANPEAVIALAKAYIKMEEALRRINYCLDGYWNDEQRAQNFETHAEVITRAQKQARAALPQQKEPVK